MQVFTIFANNRLRNNQYIIEADINVSIDPFDGEQICQYFNDRQITASVLINTHQHYDHIRGNDLVKKTGAKLIDNEMLLSKELKLDQKFSLKALFTPGHTLDSYSYMILSQETGKCEHIILGDTLFHLGVGNCYNGGDSKTLAETILKLDKQIDDETNLLLGHDYFDSNLKFSKQNFELPSNFDTHTQNQEQYMKWGIQKSVNPFLRVLFEPEFRKKYYEQQEPVEAFMSMRELRDKF